MSADKRSDVSQQDLPEEVRRLVFGEKTLCTYEEKEKTYGKFIKYTNINTPDDIQFVKQFVVGLGKTFNKKRDKPHQHTLKRLSYKQRKQLGLYSLSKNSLKFKDLLPLHDLWIQYMKECLNLEEIKQNGWLNSPEDSNFEGVSLKLFRADYHGCFLNVVRSSCPSLVGKSGIVAMETRNCFRIVSRDNVVRSIPKATCEFEFSIDEIQFSFFGKNLQAKPADRSSKKIKSIQESDI